MEWAYSIRPYNRVRARVQKNGSVYATVSGVWWAYSIRPYNRVRTILRNTDAILQPGTCEGSKNGSVYATVGGVWWAYSIRPYNRVRAILRNTDAILQLGMCDASKYRCNSSTRYVRGFKKWICIRHCRWRMVGCIRYAPMTGYVRFFKIPMRSPNWVRVRVQKMDLYTPPSVAYGRAYAIRLYNWVRAILQNTDAISQLGMCEGSKNGSVFATVGGVW